MNKLNSGFNKNSQETLTHILELFENLSNPEIVLIKGGNNCVVNTIVYYTLNPFSSKPRDEA